MATTGPNSMVMMFQFDHTWPLQQEFLSVGCIKPDKGQNESK